MPTVHAAHAAGFAERTGMVKNKRDCQLHPEKPVVIGRKKPEMYLAGPIQQKNAVGFYFFPAFSCDEAQSKLSPELLEHLDGKACFHFKKRTPDNKAISQQESLSLQCGV